MFFFFLIHQQVNESPENLKYLWYPELEIYGLETFGRQRVLKEMSGVRVMKNKTINYELGWAEIRGFLYLMEIFRVRVTISCKMNFDDYPLDDHVCQFQVGSCKSVNYFKLKLHFLPEFPRLWHHRDGDLLFKVPLQLRETKKSPAFHWNRGATAALRHCGPSLRSGQILSLFSHLSTFIFRSLRCMWLSSEIEQKADAISNSGDLINHRRLLKYRLTHLNPYFL